MVPNCVPAGGMKKGGLKTWFKEKWVDIGAPKKNGKFRPLKKICKWWFKKKVSKMRTPCKSHSDVKSRKGRGAVARKSARGIWGPKPTNVKTFASKGAFTKLYYGGMIDT